MIYAAPSYGEAAPVADFPERVDVHWETESRLMWNEQERTTEEQELIYEVGWIPELGSGAAFSGRGRGRRDHSRAIESRSVRNATLR